MYYSLTPILSRNAVYNFVVGGRGIGKTYGAKVWAIRDYLKNGKEFIYLRRFATELTTKQTFFDDCAHEFPDYGFRVLGDLAQLTRNPDVTKPKWETFGYFAALSQAQSKKSVAYPRVTKIIFDEFIIEKGFTQYLPAEHKRLNDFYNTVDRSKDKTRVIFLANSVSIMNPYFSEYDIKPPAKGEFVTRKNGFIVAQFPKSAEFMEYVKQTRFGQFISGTEYESYSVGNTFADNHDGLIATKPSEATYLATMELSGGSFSIWTHTASAYYVQEKRPKNERIFVLNPVRMNRGKTLMVYSDGLAQILRTAYRHGRMYFDCPRTRNAFTEIFKR
ncbi:phage DNA encapsidation protein [Atopobiaceae bacterium HCP3S3_F7]|jgi:hypothetical protein